MTTQHTEQLNNIASQQLRLTVPSAGGAPTDLESNITPFAMSHRNTNSVEGEMIVSFLSESLKLMKSLRESFMNQGADGLQQSAQELKGNVVSFATNVASESLRKLETERQLLAEELDDARNAYQDVEDRITQLRPTVATMLRGLAA